MDNSTCIDQRCLSSTGCQDLARGLEVRCAIAPPIAAGRLVAFNILSVPITVRPGNIESAPDLQVGTSLVRSTSMKQSQRNKRGRNTFLKKQLVRIAMIAVFVATDPTAGSAAQETEISWAI